MANTGSQHLKDDFERKVRVSIDSAHYEVHRGKSFHFSDSVQKDAAGVQKYLITVPDEVYPHMIIHVDGLLKTTVELYEGADRTGTSEQTPRNRNRNSSNTPDVDVHKDVSDGTTDGTRIVYRIYGSATLPFQNIKEQRNVDEWILKAGTKYLLTLTSGANGNQINVAFDWYE